MRRASGVASYRHILIFSIVSFLAIISFPVFNLMVTEPLFIKHASKSAEDEAFHVAYHASAMLKLDTLDLSDEMLNGSFEATTESLMRDFNIYRLKIFSPDGRLVYSSDSEPLGKINREDYFVNIVSAGRPYSKVILDSELSLENEKVSANLIEAYVPVMADGRFSGALEIYYNISSRVLEFNKLLKNFYAIIIILPSLLFIALMLAVYKLTQAVRVRDRQHMRLVETHDALLRATEEATMANSAKSEFLAMMSHEVRTPMTGILGLSDFLLDSQVNSSQREWVLMIKKSASALLRVINDVLDLSRVESGRMEFDSVEFSLRESLSSTLGVFNHVASKKNIEMCLMVEEDVPDTLMGDPDRLSQVLINLLGNAMKFTESGNVSMSVKRMDGDEDSVILGFSVKDTGPGIPEEKLKGIFEPFTRLGTRKAGRPEGTGLGLSIARSIVEQMKGYMRVESITGKGSTFSFTATFALSAISSEVRQSAANKALVNSVSARDCSLRVLVVEDNMICQKIASTILDKAGHASFIANNAMEAIEALTAGAFDLILLDIEMPGMSGLEAVGHIRKLDDTHARKTPVIAVTANVMKGCEEKYIESGMDDYIPKPYTAEDLIYIVETHGCA